MRVLQLIDSLAAGGAERMAVNYANALGDEVSFSGLVATRGEGNLKNRLSPKVEYLFLHKKHVLDVSALMRLHRFVLGNKIEIIHAHSSSFFMAVLLKFVCWKLKIVWHDHNGNRLQTVIEKQRLLQFFSFFFNGIVACNPDLKMWSESNLKVSKVSYLPNFSLGSEGEIKKTILQGSSGKRIICLANLRYPKNHLTLLKAFADSKAINDGWTLHCLGQDYKDDYSECLHNFIRKNQIDQQVFFYGSCQDVFSALKQADIGVLLSTHEGFPVTLLEYGMSSIAVLSSHVGYCSKLIHDRETGFLVSPQDLEQIKERLDILAEDKSLRFLFSQKLHTFVTENYSQKAVMKSVLAFYQSL